MARLPDAVGMRMASEAYAIAQIPHAYCSIQGVARSCDSRGERVGVIQRHHRDIQTVRLETIPKVLGNMQAFELPQVRRFLNDAAPDNPGQSGAHGFHGTFRGQFQNLAPQNIHDFVYRE